MLLMQLINQDTSELMKQSVSKSKVSMSDINSQTEIAFPVSILDNYLAHTFHRQPFNTTLISITATDGDPKMALLMANSHANVFMELVRQQRFTCAMTNVDYLFLSVN